MIRPVMSYVMTGIILLSQVGLPLHMHYCKGMLESVSVFFNAGCDDHENADLPVCCQKETAGNCSKNKKACCDDEVKVLLQDFDSVARHFDSWDIASVLPQSMIFPLTPAAELKTSVLTCGHSADSGPPIYILFGSLIYYE